MEKRISVAPMMGQTDRHFRYMISLIAKDVKLYTPMIHAEAIVHSEKNFINRENKNQKKVGIQIAGNDPKIVARAARIIEQHNYNEINLNTLGLFIWIILSFIVATKFFVWKEVAG